MTKKEFLDQIEQRSDLEAEDAERIASAVLLTLRTRLSSNEIIDISENLPEDIEKLWEGGWLQRLMSRLQSLRAMDQDEFLEQIREAADLPDIADTKRITEIVFNVLKSAIPAQEVEHISSELPEDLRTFWKAA